MRRNEKLEAAIRVCRENGIIFTYKIGGSGHIKFYVNGSTRPIIMSLQHKGAAPPSILKDIQRDVRNAIGI